METFLSTVLLQAPRLALVWLVLVGFAGLATGAVFTLPRRTRFDEAAQRVRRAALPMASEVEKEWRRSSATPTRSGWPLSARRRPHADGARSGWPRRRPLRRRGRRTRPRTRKPETGASRRISAVRHGPHPRRVRVPRTAPAPHRAAGVSPGAPVGRAVRRRPRRGQRLGSRRHPAEQELILARVVRDNLRLRYRVAAERERLAWYEADRAAAAALSLRDEAARAAEQAHWIRQRIAQTASRRAVRKRAALTHPRPAAAPLVVPRPRRSSECALAAPMAAAPMATSVSGTATGLAASASGTTALIPRQRSAASQRLEAQPV